MSRYTPEEAEVIIRRLPILLADKSQQLFQRLGPELTVEDAIDACILMLKRLHEDLTNDVKEESK